MHSVLSLLRLGAWEPISGSDFACMNHHTSILIFQPSKGNHVLNF